MTYTLEKLNEMMERNGGSLDLEGCTSLTSLPEGLTVGGSLDLRRTAITSLPEGLTVGGSLDLEGCTSLTSLPEGLTVGGSLYLSGTAITSLPEGLTVGGSLDLEGCTCADKIREITRNFTQGEYVPNRYVYADGILTHVKRKRKIGKYTYFVGKIPGKNVITDGELYAHCKTFKDGVEDIEFKRAKKRGAQQYKSLTLDSVVKKDEAIQMYRIITGACRAGTEQFLSTIKEFKAEYTVGEIVELTKGHYGATVFADFFNKE